MQERVVAIQEAMATIRDLDKDETRRGTVRDSILLLGKLRATEAVPLLVEHLNYGVFYKESKRLQTPEDYYPAGQALIDIGIPSLDPVVTAMTATDDATMHQLGARIIVKILGPKLAGVYLQDKIQAETEQTRRTRLQAVMAYLNRVQ
jgi:hypothetical protein